jgi:hypothetical protein
MLERMELLEQLVCKERLAHLEAQLELLELQDRKVLLEQLALLDRLGHKVLLE